MRAESLKKLFGFIFVLIPILVVAADYATFSYVSKLYDKAEAMRGELSVYAKQLAQLEDRIGFYKGIFGRLDVKTFAEAPKTGVELFSLVQRHLAANGVLSRVIDEDPRGSSEGDRGVRISFEGPYESLVKTLADWRGLDVALRLRKFSIEEDTETMIKGDTVLETVFGK